MFSSTVVGTVLKAPIITRIFLLSSFSIFSIFHTSDYHRRQLSNQTGILHLSIDIDYRLFTAQKTLQCFPVPLLLFYCVLLIYLSLQANPKVFYMCLTQDVFSLWEYHVYNLLNHFWYRFHCIFIMSPDFALILCKLWAFINNMGSGLIRLVTFSA